MVEENINKKNFGQKIAKNRKTELIYRFSTEL